MPWSERKIAIDRHDMADYLGTAPSAAAAPPAWVWPLQGLRCRPFKLFELPAVYQPLPVRIFR
jgi:hypothetical protein